MIATGAGIVTGVSFYFAFSSHWVVGVFAMVVVQQVLLWLFQWRYPAVDCGGASREPGRDYSSYFLVGIALFLVVGVFANVVYY